MNLEFDFLTSFLLQPSSSLFHNPDLAFQCSDLSLLFTFSPSGLLNRCVSRRQETYSFRKRYKDLVQPRHSFCTMSTSISFDEFGDLRLDIGKSSTSYTVCSKAMARSSPAFRSMLYGGFKETRPAVGDWIVRLPEEEPDAFAIILNVVHGRTDRVPRDFTDGGKDSNNRGATLLYNVARIADKYVMISLLRPWTDQWLEPFRPHRPENRGNRWSGELATAAWLLGDEVVLAYQLDQAAITMYFRGMAYKGRGWVKDITGQEFRVGAAPEGPHELIDLEGFSGKFYIWKLLD
jgi:hypothetical protein